MKTIYLKSAQIVFTILLSIFCMSLQAQDAIHYTSINGTVRDKQTNKKLEYVSISVAGTGIGTITNTDGGFALKVKDSLQAKTLEVSHIGYSNQQFPKFDYKHADRILS